jgi:hypothetical protein
MTEWTNIIRPLSILYIYIYHFYCHKGKYYDNSGSTGGGLLHPFIIVNAIPTPKIIHILLSSFGGGIIENLRF